QCAQRPVEASGAAVFDAATLVLKPRKQLNDARIAVVVRLQRSQKRFTVEQLAKSAKIPSRACRPSWLEPAFDTGRMFRSITRHGQVGGLSDRAVALIVKQRGKAVDGLDPERLAGHSLRAGLATKAMHLHLGKTSSASSTAKMTRRCGR